MGIINYKFDVDERVKIKDMDYKGKVMDRSFPFSKGLTSFIPGKHYTVMVQDKDYMIVDGKKMYLNLTKVSFRENGLEKITKKMTNKNTNQTRVGVYDSYTHSIVSALEGIYQSAEEGNISLKRFTEFPDKFPTDIDVLIINPDVGTARTQRGQIEKMVNGGRENKTPVYIIDPQSILREWEGLKLEGAKYLDLSEESFDAHYLSLYN